MTSDGLENGLSGWLRVHRMGKTTPLRLKHGLSHPVGEAAQDAFDRDLITELADDEELEE